jgi:hypothetical protein
MGRRAFFGEAFFFEAPFAFVSFEAPRREPARRFRRSASVFAVGFARAPLDVPVGVPAPAAAAGFGLRRLRRRFRGGGSPETEGTSSPAMTCG